MEKRKERERDGMVGFRVERERVEMRIPDQFESQTVSNEFYKVKKRNSEIFVNIAKCMSFNDLSQLPQVGDLEEEEREDRLLKVLKRQVGKDYGLGWRMTGK